jgi:hypothetical protein
MMSANSITSWTHALSTPAGWHLASEKVPRSSGFVVAVRQAMQRGGADVGRTDYQQGHETGRARAEASKTNSLSESVLSKVSS